MKQSSNTLKKAIIILIVAISTLNGYAQLSDNKISASSQNQVLPVTSSNFTVQSDKPNTITVKWSTANETNNSHFVILMSKDGSNFVKMGQVQGSGNSATQKDYQFVIDNVATSILSGSLPFLILLLIPSFRNKKLRLVIFSLFVLIIISCSKTKEELIELKTFYINLEQIDNDGKTYYYDTLPIDVEVAKK